MSSLRGRLRSDIQPYTTERPGVLSLDFRLDYESTDLSPADSGEYAYEIVVVGNCSHDTQADTIDGLFVEA
jgi:hypothetical protein